jgi:hypothetical protein
VLVARSLEVAPKGAFADECLVAVTQALTKGAQHGLAHLRFALGLGEVAAHRVEAITAVGASRCERLGVMHQIRRNGVVQFGPMRLLSPQ